MVVLYHIKASNKKKKKKDLPAVGLELGTPTTKFRTITALDHSAMVLLEVARVGCVMQ